jgi:imidazolonepropionase-like amidohydrolase
VFHHKGGGLLTGTDSLLPGLVPGFALQRELRELVDVGMSPFEALRTSTTAPFEYLGEVDTRGTIELGKETDLKPVFRPPETSTSSLTPPPNQVPAATRTRSPGAATKVAAPIEPQGSAMEVQLVGAVPPCTT